jgi:hypothetical protein
MAGSLLLDLGALRRPFRRLTRALAIPGRRRPASCDSVIFKDYTERDSTSILTPVKAYATVERQPTRAINPSVALALSYTFIWLKSSEFHGG